MNKPHAPACARNRDAILTVLRDHLLQPADVLELASGTGQHAVYFAGAMPHLHWQCSDLADNLPGISLWLEEASLHNIKPPIVLNVADPWPTRRFDVLFSANSLHIMPWPAVVNLFAAVPACLRPKGRVIIYGPFNYGGQYTSESNALFDVWLKAHVPHQGIRDFEAVAKLAHAAGLRLLEDRAMPANNRCLVWQADPLEARTSDGDVPAMG